MQDEFNFDFRIERRENGALDFKRLFPLQFLCDYLTDKQEELLRRELDTAFRVNRIKADSGEALEQLEALCRKKSSYDDAQLIEALESMCAKQTEIYERLVSLETELTLKAAAFEDMSNMLTQTEPMITKLVCKDALTNAYNRYFLEKRIPEFFQKAVEGNDFSLAFVDLDNFKYFNTKYGHAFGDKVLQTLNHIVSGVINKMADTYFVRIGGDEFLLLNMGMDFDKFVEHLEEIRMQVAAFTIPYHDTQVSISLSMGVANTAADEVRTPGELVKISDQRLYMAKQQGKNNIVHSS